MESFGFTRDLELAKQRMLLLRSKRNSKALLTEDEYQEYIRLTKDILKAERLIKSCV